ncbi:LysR family transcriptional regulator [Apilactobacillus kunkeei]|uniref:LysR family transcriptional regulator n=1 Tax=Apilactobacillus kunkeei TaxID=148814 RepID=UPI0006B24777|nr:LysR family transcriptional regulator [Apilactobacillus kunkeei]KOY69086.1 LysR family transcriptional regulator [Apilactobacillus kunkeei]CAI2636937.1 HTH-type transcriptional regulator GltC [Apilactobacillus kunkeei]CAI2640940.1 HTH-type transcriptional regulator GltC [Apilactobacillus kunkeei]CAI2641630.1 HTH-type transcriptional regulator GltC [Apilactobacillus kunkeei]CAI2642419.1 HTH-type transcriptional regulator GltC [Apilactobacillus kunkeei]
MNRFIVLEAVLRNKSFTKAAEQLGYTQSSVSQMMSNLEKEFNMHILKRSRSGVELTPDGEKLYPHIRQALRQYRGLIDTANAINGLQSGTVRIGAITSVSCYWLPDLFKEFKALYPQINFVLNQGDYGTIIDWLKTDQIDFAIMTAEYGEGFNKTIVHNTNMNAFIPVDHPYANADSVPIEALADDPFILVEGGGYSEPLEAFKRSGVTPNVRYKIQDDYTIMAMVEAGLGVSILSELVYRRTDFNIVSKPVDPNVTRPVAIVYKSKDELPIASQHFAKFIIDRKEELK